MNQSSSSVDECARREIPKGTVLEFFAPNFYEGAGLTREELREAIGYDLRGRNPRLSMVADRTDGRLVLLFMLDRAGRNSWRRPGGPPVAGSPMTQNQLRLRHMTTATRAHPRWSSYGTNNTSVRSTTRSWA
ncbi:MAG: hypothetical protein IPH65_12715 [Dehalococcoidia bacterium]|uniref:hypothetical protein n=1 Tax=Candidatus Amarobacter glycogenicus TaxID=3140699 RepID=UPI003136F392|nr:hypothetical protein [Dehalococcoidia bacterium]